MPDRLWGDIVAALDLIPVDFGGGCPVAKANVMAWLIREFGVAASVEIGVYRGRSLIPQAIAHKATRGGVAVGVDPYSRDIAMEHDNPRLAAAIEKFVEATDWDALFRGVVDIRGRLGLQDHCMLLRQSGAEAAADLARQGRRFGLAHIDGNHDTVHVTKDVELYLPLIEEGGFIVMDDITWDSVKPAVAALAEQATLLVEVPANILGDYAVFRRGPASDDLKARLRRIAFDEPGALD
jgi:predicted O-methyltransferase YrrM